MVCVSCAGFAFGDFALEVFDGLLLAVGLPLDELAVAFPVIVIVLGFEQFEAVSFGFHGPWDAAVGSYADAFGVGTEAVGELFEAFVGGFPEGGSMLDGVHLPIFALEFVGVFDAVPEFGQPDGVD